MPDHIPEPSTTERRAMMSAAIAEVRTAQAQIATVREGETQGAPAPHGESLQPMGTLPVRPTPTAQVEELQKRFPETYKRILRAAARALEPDEQTRHRIYELLNCAPGKEE